MATDPKVIEQANPGCPKRISLDFLLDEARTLDPASFATEHLNVGDWPDLEGRASTVVNLDKWQAAVDSESTPLAPVCIGFDISPDRRRASIAVAGQRLDGGLHVELVDNHDGVGWLVPRLAQLVADHDPHGVACDEAHALIAEQVFQRAGLRPTMLDRAELGQACAHFVDLVEQEELRHLDDHLLLDAIRGAGTTSQGGDGWLFSRRNSRMDISPLYAAVVALMEVQRMPDALSELHIY